MGTFYYSKNIKKTISSQTKKLKKNGRLIFSLRNQLFDISTMNDYSVKFFNELYKIKKFDKSIQSKFKNFFFSFNKRKKINLKNIDDQKVFSQTHNPLTIEDNLLKNSNLSLQGIYFYHFHFLPPVFESIFPIKYKKESWKIENPKDWRGFFLASGFIVDCKKIK